MATLSNCTSASGRPSDAARGEMDRLDPGGAGGCAPVLLLVVVNTAAGRQALEWLTPRVTGDTVRLAGIAGRFPDALRVARVELRDPQGAYATVEDLALDWSPPQLLHRRIVIDRLEAARIEAVRMPAGSSSGSAGLPMPVDPARAAGCAAGRRPGIGRRRRCRCAGRFGRTRLADRFQREPQRPPARWRAAAMR